MKSNLTRKSLLAFLALLCCTAIVFSATDTLTNGAKRQDTRSSTDGPAQRAYDNATLLDVLLGEGKGGVITVAASDTAANLKALADYVCDGTDDHVEFNTALAQGGKVVSLDGSFTPSDSIEIPSNGHLHTGNNSRFTLAASSDVPILTNSDPTGGNVNIKVTGGGTFDHNGANQTSSTHGVLFDNVTGLVVEDIKVTGGRGWDLRLENCTLAVISGVDTYGPGGSANTGGIQTRNTCSKIWLVDCVARAHTDGAGYGIWIMGTDISVVGCRSYGNDDDNLVIGNNAANDAVRVMALGGFYTDSVSDGGVHVTSGSVDVTLDGGVYSNNDLVGIKVGGTNIFRVKLIGVSANLNGTTGITVSEDGTLLNGVTAEANGERGVLIASSCARVSILNSSIRANTDSNIELHSSATATDLLIANCLLDSSGDWGVDLNGTIDEVMIQNNFIESNTTGGVDGDGAATGVTTDMNRGGQKPADSDQRADAWGGDYAPLRFVGSGHDLRRAA